VVDGTVRYADTATATPPISRGYALVNSFIAPSPVIWIAGRFTAMPATENVIDGGAVPTVLIASGSLDLVRD
jgi:hypothetical protein